MTRAGEIAAFGLRTARGLPSASIAHWRSELEPHFEHGLIVEEKDRVRLTPRGKLLADSVAEVFVGG
jgi:coproporphyrinogen III oxidase-like Fe-S oxidoreductase